MYKARPGAALREDPRYCDHEFVALKHLFACSSIERRMNEMKWLQELRYGFFEAHVARTELESMVRKVG